MGGLFYFIDNSSYKLFCVLLSWNVYKNHIIVVKSKDKVIFSDNWIEYTYFFVQYKDVSSTT